MKNRFVAALSAVVAVGFAAPAYASDDDFSLALRGGESKLTGSEGSVSGTFFGFEGGYRATFKNEQGVGLDVGLRAGADVLDLSGTPTLFECSVADCGVAFSQRTGYESSWRAFAFAEIGANFGDFRISAARGVGVMEIGRVAVGVYPSHTNWNFDETQYSVAKGELTEYGAEYQVSDTLSVGLYYTEEDWTRMWSDTRIGSPWSENLEGESTSLKVTKLF